MSSVRKRRGRPRVCIGPALAKIDVAVHNSAIVAITSGIDGVGIKRPVSHELGMTAAQTEAGNQKF